MKKSAVIAIVFLLFATRTGYAQTEDPCALGFKVELTKAEFLGTVPPPTKPIRWASFGEAMHDCDVMILLSDTTYWSLVYEKEYYGTLNERYESLVGELKLGQQLRDSVIEEQKSFIAFQQSTIVGFDTLLVQSNQLVRDANANTGRALDRLKMMRLTSIGTLAIGIGGVLVVAAIVK